MTEDEFEQLRPSAFAMAYRMLGSVSEAEDLVQDGFLRLHQARERGEQIESPRAYLSTVVPRLSLDHLRSARVRRETYVGDWLPEPTRANKNTRQLVTRTRRRVEERRPRFDVSREGQEQLTTRFLAAADEGDLEGLEDLLAHDVVLRADGGGNAPSIKRALHGRAKVARALIVGLRAGARIGGFTTRRAEVNRQPGALFFDPEGRLASVLILDIADGQIQCISLIVNPDKLQHLGPVADLHALRRGRS